MLAWPRAWRSPLRHLRAAFAPAPRTDTTCTTARRPEAALIAVALFLSGGCANGGGHVDPCERAIQRLVDECGFEIEGVDGLDLHCSGPSACVAICLEESPCEDIAANDRAFADCTEDCEKL